MRVAHILRKYKPSEWGGTETALQRLSEGLTHHQVKSVVFCPEDDTPGTCTTAQTDPLTEAGCTLKRYRTCVPVWGLSKQAKQQIISVGGNLLSFDLPRKLAREPDIDVVHTHTLGRLGGIALSAARRRRLPFVVSIHGGVLDLPKDLKKSLHTPVHKGVEWGRFFGWWWLSHRVLADASAIITCNTSEAGLLQQRYPHKRILTLSHGIETTPFREDHRAAAQAAFPQTAGKQFLLYTARIHSVKNQIWLVREMPRLIQRYPNMMLVLVGSCTDMPYGKLLRKEIADRKLGDRVILTGGLPPGDPRLVGLFQSASAVVVPSHAETFGIVILEAWAAGTPVLSSLTSGAKSLIRHQQNGWLFDIETPDEFHHSLDQALQEPVCAARIVSTAKWLVEEQYEKVKIAGQMRQLYSQLIREQNSLSSKMTRQKPKGLLVSP